MSEYARSVKDAQGTQENLNPQQSVFPVLVRSEETLLNEEGPTIILKNDVSDMAIWDNAQTTWDGVNTNDEWDSYNTSSQTIEAVSNPLNIFHERFGFTTLQGGNDTTTWDTTNHRVRLSGVKQVEIVPAYKHSSNTITKATLTTTADDSAITWTMSADGGSNFESVTAGTKHTFTNSGSELHIRAVRDYAAISHVSTDLYLWYPFNGNANDQIGSNNGTVSGASLTTDKNSISNQAYDFNGTSDYIEIDTDAIVTWLNEWGTEDKSISLWFNANDFTSTQRLFSTRDSTNNPTLELYIVGAAERIGFTLRDDIGNVCNPEYAHSLAEGDWVHVVVRWDFSTKTIDLFLNGTEVADANFASFSAIAGFDATNNLTFGARDTNGTKSMWFDGKMDEIRIYDQKLSEADITALYTNYDYSIYIEKITVSYTEE